MEKIKDLLEKIFDDDNQIYPFKIKNISLSENENEIGMIDGEVVIKVSKEFYRPYTTGLLMGDPSKIESLGWKRKFDLHGLIEDMIKG